MSIRWREWVNILLGCWLALSPWEMGYALNHAARANAYGLAAALVSFNIISVCRMVDDGQEIVNILMGMWLILSPYALGFTFEKNATINATLVGTAIVVFSIWQMRVATRKPKK